MKKWLKVNYNRTHCHQSEHALDCNRKPETNKNCKGETLLCVVSVASQVFN